jgi:hypothetical protein
MKRTFLNVIILISIVAFAFCSCSKIDDEILPQNDQNSSSLKASTWSKVFEDYFSSTASLYNWSAAERYDYNSDYCYYKSSNPTIATYGGVSCLVLTATKSGSIWNSGFVKSNYSFTPATNESYRISAYIKMVAVSGTSYPAFSKTYGVWPAFWTTNETYWPMKGEVDIMEAYTKGGTAEYKANLHYGTALNTDLLTNDNSCEVSYGDVGTGFHKYDLYWTNSNGAITLIIKVDDVVKATYNDATNSLLTLSNFSAHNIILNLCVGDNYGIFTNSSNNVYTKTMMLVDFVVVYKKTI